MTDPSDTEPLRLFGDPVRFPPLPTLAAESLPWLTVARMAEADRLATGLFGISLLQMVEHAGTALAEITMRTAPYGLVTVLAGSGNNGAGGACAARHLADRGRDVEIVLASEHAGPALEHHLATLAAMGVRPRREPSGGVAVDALAGYGIANPLHGRSAELAAWTRDIPTVSLDFPSGLGFPGAVEPDATLTLALPKEALAGIRPLFLADLGLPAQLWARLGVLVGSPFREGPIVEIV